MRRIALVSVVLFACDTGSSDGPAGFDDELPARMDCTSAGYYAVGGGQTAWRGTLDTQTGAFDFVAGPHHEDAPFPGEVEYPEMHLDGTTAWDGSEGRLRFDSDTTDFSLQRIWRVNGFVVKGDLDLGQGEPVAVYCWNPEITSGFVYDATDGTCRDANGEEGTEPRPVELIRETGDGQCADLTGIALDEGDLSYQAWDGFDLRGADLTGASLHFADITNSSLEGAQMDTLDYGYAQITGTIDDHTAVPLDGCEVTYTSLQCMR